MLICVDLCGPLPVPSYIVGETELEASKEGRSLNDFKYACVGYSVYLDKNSSNDPENKQADLPFCVGLEVKHPYICVFICLDICNFLQKS